MKPNQRTDGHRIPTSGFHYHISSRSPPCPRLHRPSWFGLPPNDERSAEYNRRNPDDLPSQRGNLSMACVPLSAHRSHPGRPHGKVQAVHREQDAGGPTWRLERILAPGLHDRRRLPPSHRCSHHQSADTSTRSRAGFRRDCCVDGCMWRGCFAGRNSRWP